MCKRTCKKCRTRSRQVDGLKGQRKRLPIRDEQQRKEQVYEMLQRIRGGPLQRHAVSLQQLLTNRNRQKEVAAVLQKCRIDCANHKYEADLQACRNSFENDKQRAKEAITNKLTEQLRLLAEHYHVLKVSWAAYTKPKPCIVEEKILED